VLLLALGGLGSAGILVSDIPRDSSLAQLFPSGSKAQEQFEDFDRAFGTDDTLLITVSVSDSDSETETVFRADCLDYLQILADHFQQQPGVQSVVSLATLQDFDVHSLFGLKTPGLPRPFLPDDRTTITDEQRRRWVVDPLLQHGLISADARTAACWVMLKPELRNSPEYLQKAGELAAEFPRPSSDPLRVIVTGFPILHGATLDLLWRDGWRLLLAAVGAVALVAVAGRLPWFAVLGFLLSWGITVGLLALTLTALQRPLHVFSNTLLPLLLITSCAQLVHLGRTLGQQGRSGRHSRHVLRSCFLATITTAVGFGSLALSPLPALSWLGVEVVVGTFLSFVVLSAVLWWLAPVRGTDGQENHNGRVSLPAIAVILSLLLGLPWFLAHPERVGALGDFLEYLPEDHIATRDAQEAQQAFGGLTSLEIIVALPEDHHEELLSDPDFYLRLAEFEKDLIEDYGDRIPFVLSPVSLLSYLNTKIVDQADPAQHFHPTRESAVFAIRFLILPYLKFFRGEPETTSQSSLLNSYRDQMRQLLSREGNRLRFGCRIPHLDPEEILSLTEELRNNLFARHQPLLGADSIYTTGYSVLVSRTTQEVQRTQMRSLLVGGLALALVLLVVLRSPILWLCAVLSNTLALAALANLLWLFALPLHLYSTVLVASLLGVIVDDTLHLLLWYRHYRKRTDQPMRNALRSVRGAMILSSLSLGAGFALFLISELSVYRQFACCAMAGIALALWYDLKLLPALVERFSRRGGL
jgi:hypothetical protein